MKARIEKKCIKFFLNPSYFHTMLSVKNVKDNMQLVFIEKFFINYATGINMQTKYLRFKGMLYENENYMCHINYVQLQKVLTQFRCDNTQFEVVLGVWKSVSYVERLCQGYDLRKVEDEKHQLLVCLNTQKSFGPTSHSHQHSC